MSKPLRTLGIEIDVLADKAKDELMEWNKEVKESLGIAENYVGSTNDMSKEMLDYAKQTGLTKRQIREYKDVLKKNEETDFAKRVNSQAQELKKLAEASDHAKNKMSLLHGVMSGLAAVGLGSLVKSVGGEMISLAKDAEKTNLSFERLLKNKQQAKEAVDMLNDFADAGAFSDTEALAAGKRMLSLKMPIDEVKQTLHELGNVAAGSEMSLESLSEIYSKNKTLGIVQMNDIKQLSAQGIPIFEELANVLGVNSNNSEELAQKIKDMSSSGVIRFEHLRQAFSNMSKAGGEYAGEMDRMSKSAAGLSSTFNNKLSGLKATMGMVLLEGLKPLLAVGIKFLDWLQKSPVAMGVLKIALLVLIPIIGILLVVAFWSAAKAAWGLAFGVNAMIWPFIAAGAVILALILIIEDLYTFFTGGESVFGDWLAAMKDRFAEVGDFFKKWLPAIFDLFKKYGKFLIMAIFPISILYFYWDEISVFLRSIPDQIVNYFASIPDKIKSILGNLKEWFKAFFTGGESVFGDWLAAMKDRFAEVGDFFKKWLGVILNLFKKYGKYLIMAIFPISILYFYWNQISAFFRSIPDRIVNYFASIPDKIKEALGDLKESLKGILPDWAVKLLAKININGQAEAVQARATGGSVNSGEAYIVGERGPELFTPSRSGTIIPNNALSGGSKSANITIAPTINISGSTDPETVASLVMKKIQELIPAISAELGLEV
ncbi:MAG: tape measure protein [Leptospirales bacterium]|nr:tape measure protein [Leptospirales bacterium]